MGVTVSREFSDAVASCVNRGDSLESLLENPEVVDSTMFLIDVTDQTSVCASLEDLL